MTTTNFFSSLRKIIGNFIIKSWIVFLAASLAQIVVYSYFFTTITFTDHTFPNVWQYTYPSFKTQAEGRWLADLLIQAGGGAGTESFQMGLAIVLQSLNGILLARWLHLRRLRDILLITLLLCFFPTFVDYFGFAVDHISFVLGDTLCIAAVIWMRHRTWISIVGAAFCYAFALSIYGPKIALISFLTIASLILEITETKKFNVKLKVHAVLHELIHALLPLVIGLAIFGLTVKLLVVNADAGRTSMNDIHAARAAINQSYLATIRFFSGDMGGLPPKIRFLPIAIILAGGSRALMLARHSCTLPGTATALLALLATPVAISATWIINYGAGQSGRLYPAHAYFFLFYLAYLLRWHQARKPALIGSIVLCWLLINLGSQRVNAIEFKSLYERAFVQRIVARVEALIPPGDLGKNPQALVVIGEIPPFAINKYIRFPPRKATSHALNSTAFAPYRQIEIINFFLGLEGVRKPTKMEQRLIVDQSRNYNAWPAKNSTFRTDNTIAVILQPYESGISITWNQNK